LLPRQVDVGNDLVIALGLGGLFAVMGTFAGVLLMRVAAAGDAWPTLCVGALAAGLWLVPLVLVRRLLGTLRASSDAKHGRLRQGLLLGPRGLLLRLTPNTCYLVPAEEFVAATLRTNPRGPTRRQALFRIETRSDVVEFFAERLQGQPDDVKRHAKRFWSKKAKSRSDDPVGIRRASPP
jgi:hypothetical protein